MTVKVGINGFGRMGRLGLRAGWGKNGYVITHINEPAGSAGQGAHLLEFDTIHGRWDRNIYSNSNKLFIDQNEISFSMESNPKKLPWEDLQHMMVKQKCQNFYNILAYHHEEYRLKN